ncbi:MAG: hypothetical protein JXR96_23585 [Deltaproteobacteria bacterium]|nr:hypothetical protein [Deltaproteobacteria bacterium]
MRWQALLLSSLLFAACRESYIPCEQHWNCPDDMVCDEGRCIPDDGRARPCSMDMQCRLGERCRDGMCTTDPSCRSDEDCPPGMRCHMLSGDCIPGSRPCGSDADCPEGSHCDSSSGTCTMNECSSDADCAPGQVCDPQTGTCAAGGPECSSDADCMAGQRCDKVAGVCRAGGCLADSDCLAGQYCDHVTGVCRYPTGGCQSDADCPSGSWCDEDSGDCRTGCRTDADCPEGTTCEPSSGICQSSTDCSGDSDCPAGHRCNTTSGLCEPEPGQVPDGSACQANADCQSANCVPVTQPPVCLSPCRSSARCPTNWTCVEITSAWYCLNESLYSNIVGHGVDVGAGEYGQYCAGSATFNPYCHSLICHTNLGVCTTDCTTNLDCSRIAGSICRVNFETGIMRAYCFPDPGLLPIGSSCDNDYYCAFGVCLAGYYICSGGCCSTRDCPAGWACGRIQSSDPYAPGYAKGCFPADWPGTASTGSACSADTQCASGICLDQICSDLCCTDADCPSPLRCQIFVDENNLALTLCLTP